MILIPAPFSSQYVQGLTLLAFFFFGQIYIKQRTMALVWGNEGSEFPPGTHFFFFFSYVFLKLK
jgi:hypothetical protein